ncbi:MAG: site-2 protease family protein, partial [Bdellovibrionales bacterium]
ETSDNRDSQYKTIVYSSVNTHLLDPDHKRYEEIYLGGIRDNFYKDLSVGEALVLAFETTKKMFVDVASLPAQIFPIDGRKVKPETKVYDDAMPVRNFIFRAGFFIGVISIFIGFVNLIPLPHFDGGQLLLLTAQKFKKNPLTRKQRARIIVVALVVMYVSVMLMNIKKLPLYVDAKIESLQEFIEDF